MHCMCSADIEHASYLLIEAGGVGCVYVWVCGGVAGCWEGYGWMCVDIAVEYNDSFEKEVKVIIEAVK